MLRGETEIRAYIETLRCTRPETKDDVRALLLQRKRENLLRLRKELKQQERRAVRLVRNVDWDRIRPRLVHVAPPDRDLWFYLRHILSSAPYWGRPGRCNLFFALDECSGGLLGIVEMGSDVHQLSPRDQYIGWNHDRKFSGGLNYLANVGTCVSVGPFGLLTGGKFQLVACTSSEISAFWSQRYGETLAAITTTALYGKSSVYNRLKEFQYLGNSQGMGNFNVSKDGHRQLKNFMDVNGLRVRKGNGVSMDPKNKHDLLNRVCSILEVPREYISTAQPRGVYFGELGSNTLPFLRGTETEFHSTTRPQEEIRDWWLTRWYPGRLEFCREQLRQFDPRTLTIEAQIDLCVISETGDTDAVQVSEVGSTPAITLQQTA